MDNFFTFRLDSAIKNRLDKLAGQTQQSRGGVIRWLILNANLQENLEPPWVDDLSEKKDLPHVEPESEENE